MKSRKIFWRDSSFITYLQGYVPKLEVAAAEAASVLEEHSLFWLEVEGGKESRRLADLAAKLRKVLDHGSGKRKKRKTKVRKGRN